MKKVYCTSLDGSHIACFETEAEARHSAEDMRRRYIEISEDDYDADCDCKNQNISEDWDKK